MTKNKGKTRNKLLGFLVAVGLLSLNTQPFIALAQTATSDSGVAVFSEDFNGTADAGVPSDEWSRDGDWGVAYVGESFNKVLYGDFFHIPYVSQPGARVATPSINLDGANSANISFVTRCETEYSAGTDFMTLQASADGTSWSDIMTWNEKTIDNDGEKNGRVVKEFNNVEIPSEFLTGNMKIGFVWTANANDNDYDGCFVDDIVVMKDGVGSNDDNDDEDTETPDTTDDEDTTDDGTTDDDTTATTTDDTATTTDNTNTDTDTDTDTGTTTTPTPDEDEDTDTTDDNDGDSEQDSNENVVENISECRELQSANTTYVLTQNISTSDTCLRVMADNITIDGNGFEIFGDLIPGTYGVVADQRTGIKIKNISIREFDFGTRFINVNDSVVDDVLYKDNSYGFVLHGGSDNEIQNVQAERNVNAGIYLKDGTENTVKNSSAMGNAVGIHLDQGSENTVTGNTVRNNDRGILLIGSTNNAINSNSVIDNTFGIALEIVSTGNSLSNMTLTTNNEGLVLASGNNTVENITIEGSRSRALRFFEHNSTGNTITNVHITNTQGDGLDLSFDDAGVNYAAAGVDGTVFTNTPIGRYFITSPGGSFGIANSFGSVTFTGDASGQGASLSSDIRIEDRKITLSPAFGNVPATLVFAPSSTLTDTSVTRDGAACNTCTAGANNMTFSVTGAGTYELHGTVTDDEPATTTDDGNVDDDTGTSTATTTPDTDTGGNATTTPDTNTGTSTATTTDATDQTNDTEDDEETNNDDDDDDNGSSTTIIRRNSSSSGGGTSGNTSSETGESSITDAELEAIIAIITAPVAEAAGPGTTVVSGNADATVGVDGGAVVASDIPSGVDAEADTNFTGTGGPEDFIEFGEGTTTQTAAIGDLLDEENPNRWRNLGIGVLILLIILAIIFGMSRRV